MKKKPVIALIIALSLALSLSLVAQDRTTEFKDKLWYGGNVGLGFSSNNYESYFGLELSPMVGYKIFPRFSVGPRLIFRYAHYRTRYSGPLDKFNLYSIGAGAFSRYKIIDQIFIHGEVNFLREQNVINTINGLDKINHFTHHILLGVGYDSGYGEIMILYDFLSPANSIQLPFKFRFGFNINF